MKASFISVTVILFVAAAAPASAKDITIEVKDVAFIPAKISAHVKDTLHWNNKDIIAHSATARDKQWDITLPAGHSGKTMLMKAGRIEYYCKYHPNMTGVIEVAP